MTRMFGATEMSGPPGTGLPDPLTGRVRGVALANPPLNVRM